MALPEATNQSVMSPSKSSRHTPGTPVSARPLSERTASISASGVNAVGCSSGWFRIGIGSAFIVVGILPRYLRARISAANAAGLLVRAFRVVRRMQASLKPAALNSLRKAPPSFAPAIQANQLLSPAFASGGKGSRRINSAPYKRPPGRMHRANSPKIASLAGFRLKIPLTIAQCRPAACQRVQWRPQSSQHASPRSPSTPSLVMIGAITSPATGSAHHHPATAFRSNPPKRIADR
jgi:hypothetical protein